MKFVILLLLSFFIILSCTDSSTSPEEESLKKPANLESQQIDNTSILLTWEDRSDDETGFKIDRKVDIAAWENIFRILGEGATGYLDTSLTVFGEYQYRLSAFNELEETEAIISSIQFRDLDSLNAPSNLVLQEIDDFSILISWRDNSSAEEGFCIDRKIGNNAWEENFQILDTNSSMFIDEDLITIENYTYRVRAFIGDEFSEPIEEEIYFFYNDVEMVTLEVEQSLLPVNPFSKELTASLLDGTMNLIEREYTVWFKIVSDLEGLNINNVLFGTEDSLHVQSESGQAIVSLNAGTEQGFAAVEVFVYNIRNERISSIKSNIHIYTPGPPDNIEIVIGSSDSGLDMGGGVWQIEVAAIINDNIGNPCNYGTAVWFSLTDSQYPGNDPDWATVGAEAYIGNENTNGDSLEGVAFTVLNYEGSHTNDSLLINIEVSGVAGNLTAATLVAMPIQFASIDITATPIHVDWIDATNNEDSLATTIIVEVTDGQNNPINNQTVYFTCSLGMPFPTYPGADPFTGFTGFVNGQNGLLHKEVYFQKYECQPPTPAPPGTSQAVVEAIILGTNVSEVVTVTLYRYID